MTNSTKKAVQWILGGIALVLISKGKRSPAIHTLFQLSPMMGRSMIVWVIFSLYWAIAAKDSAPTARSEPVWSRQFHVVLVNGALLLLVLSVPGLTHRFLPVSAALEWVGLGIQAAFVLLAIWARRILGSNWSGEVRIATEHRLIQSGPYRLVRHPIYTAILWMYFGTMLISGEIHAPLALLVITLAYWRKIRLEERALGETFGADFDAYRRDTWALVPMVF